ncbi:MAG: hypothetical protein PHN88_09105 [Ignavibacteria bacterium]|nr:hypothetical protein [Ignavibacteria bacterium]
MDKKELIEKELQPAGDIEIEHQMADELLLEYIDDEEIKNKYDKVEKWYA